MWKLYHKQKLINQANRKEQIIYNQFGGVAYLDIQVKKDYVKIKHNEQTYLLKEV